MNPTTDHKQIVTDAIRYWEPRRLIYNGVLTAIVIGYFIAAWPDSRETLSLNYFLGLFVLAVLANMAYSAAYVVDLFVQMSGYRELWRRGRAALLWLGIAFAAVVTRGLAISMFYQPSF